MIAICGLLPRHVCAHLVVQHHGVHIAERDAVGGVTGVLRLMGQRVDGAAVGGGRSEKHVPHKGPNECNEVVQIRAPIQLSSAAPPTVPIPNLRYISEPYTKQDKK
jgi:hypothetical protein